MAKVHLDQCPLCHSKALTPVFSVRDHQVSGEYFTLAKCAGCNFLFTQDHPDAAHSGPYYASSDYVSHSDTQAGLINTLYHWVRQWMLNRKRRLVHQLVPGDKILDYGCGTGYFLNAMQLSGWQVTGMDVSAEAARVAHEKFGINVQPVEHLSRFRNEFQVITLWHVLEHVHELKSTLRHLHTALTAGGYLILALPNHHSVDAEVYGASWGGYDVPRHLWHFRAETILLATKNLFAIQAMQMLPFDAFYVSLLSEKYRQTGWLGVVRAFWIGARSWIAGVSNVKRASSVVYVFKKISS